MNAVKSPTLWNVQRHRWEGEERTVHLSGSSRFRSQCYLQFYFPFFPSLVSVPPLPSSVFYFRCACKNKNETANLLLPLHRPTDPSPLPECWSHISLWLTSSYVGVSKLDSWYPEPPPLSSKPVRGHIWNTTRERGSIGQCSCLPGPNGEASCR